MSRVSGLGRRSPCHFGCKQALSSSYSGSPTHLRSQKLSLSSRDSWCAADAALKACLASLGQHLPVSRRLNGLTACRKLLDRGHFEHSRRRSWLQVGAVLRAAGCQGANTGRLTADLSTSLQVAPAPPGLELGRPEPMTISFSEVDTFKLWVRR